jgi:hypothetical protein
MYPTLFELAGIAILGWALLIFLPGWKVTRWFGETAAFPIYLSVLYVVGIVPLVVAAGPGIMRDFGSMQGVLGLLEDPDVALIAWIHILAFDHLIGVLIYRDNMRHRFVPLPLQSVFLFFTLMLGPVGFVSYWVVRRFRRERGERSGEEGSTGARSGLELGPEPSAG